MFRKGTKLFMFLPKNGPHLCLKRSISTSELIKINFNDGIKEIVMDSQKTRNSLSISMMNALIDAIKQDEQNSNLRAIVISGRGPVFSAGHNLKEIASDEEKQRCCFKTASKLMCAIIDSPVPVITKVDGLAVAAGCQLVAQSDIAVCSDKSQFSTPGANFGIFCSTPGVALARCVSKMPSLYMLLTGVSVPADEALRFGLVTKVTSSEKLDEEVEAICNMIRTKSRDVIELGKTFFYKQINYDVKKAYELGGEVMVENLQIPDCKEGIQSFIEKRKPHYGHKK